MSDIALKVENLYKRYRLGAVDRQAFKEDIVSWWASATGKPDPYEQYITSNDLAAITDSETLKKLTARYVWALQDINFEVKKGEIVGIIGKNGAGKSTLLKILSKTTTPTKGQVKVNGRIASLLEVGTGFHGELTGRENIYLNGAILGMTRHEIKKHLDEIVAFAGIDAYIDTPVKRYSSGMYVRLAFAVGAHLLSDILIVDEVLAVGDADFQKKCIGKMKDVSKGEGRTVLFVSHNMDTIRKLCAKGIILKNGNLVFDGDIQAAIGKYSERASYTNIDIIPGGLSTHNTGEAKFRTIAIIDKEGKQADNVLFKQPMQIMLGLEVFKSFENAIVDVKIISNNGDAILYYTTIFEGLKALSFQKGLYSIAVTMENELVPANYALTIGIHYIKGDTIDYVENIYPFTILQFSSTIEKDYPIGWTHGYIVGKSAWEMAKISI